MKIEAKRNLISSEEEILDLHIEWNPALQDEDRYVALIATLVDFVNDYNRLNRLSE